MKNLKKVTALTLAFTMAAGSSLVAFGAESQSGSSSGTGQFEGTVDTDVFSVVLPTGGDSDTTYDFILDPEGLIKATAASRYPGYTFDDSTLFFANAGNKYTNTSEEKTITNKSTMEVDITLTATMNPGEGISLNSDAAFTDDTRASMYMAFTDGTNTGAANESGVAVLKTSIEPLADAYHIVYATDSNAYKFELKPDATGFEEYKFALTGASNTNGDWSKLETIAPTVDVVWDVVPKSGDVLESDGTNDIVIAYSGAQPDDVVITPVSTVGTNKDPVTMTNGDKVVIEAGSVTIKATWLTALINSMARGMGTYKVTINGEETIISLYRDINDVLTSDGTNDIVINFTGAQPSDVIITPLNTTGTNKEPIPMTNGDKVVISANKVTVKSTWITTLMGSAARGTGTYKVTVNNAEYLITLN